MISDPRTTALVVVAILVLLAACFAASEGALLALSRLRLLQHKQGEEAKNLERLVTDRSNYLTTILVGNTIILLAADSLATWAAIQYGIWKPVLVATAIMTVVMLVFAEVLPKMIVVQDPTHWARRVAPFLNFMARLLRPITWALVGFTNWLIRLFGGDPNAPGPYVTEEDIKALVSVGETHGVLEEEEKEMIHSIFEFGATVVREVMTPRTDMICADVEDPVSRGVELVIREGYSKIPVYEQNIDHIVGVVHDRELLLAVSRDEEHTLLRSIMRPIKAIPENKPVDELMREMQAEKVSVAIVVDEYGGTAGLVTMEDLLEEIVGEIMDEYDAEQQDLPPEIKEASNGDVIVDARMNIDDVNERLGLHLPTEDFESIGGYTFGLFGRVPMPGEHLSIDDGLTLFVEKTAGRRLLSVRIKKPGAHTDDRNTGREESRAKTG